MAAVQLDVVTVKAWSGTPESFSRAYAESEVPLAGFSVIEASSVDEVVQLVAGTPCARATGAIEIQPILAINNEQTAAGSLLITGFRAGVFRNLCQSIPIRFEAIRICPAIIDPLKLFLRKINSRRRKLIRGEERFALFCRHQRAHRPMYGEA